MGEKATESNSNYMRSPQQRRTITVDDKVAGFYN